MSGRAPCYAVIAVLTYDTIRYLRKQDAFTRAHYSCLWFQTCITNAKLAMSSWSVGSAVLTSDLTSKTIPVVSSA